MVIKIVDAKKGSTPYRIEFSVINGELDNNRTFKVEYTGTEIFHNMSLTEALEKQFKEDLNKSFGFGPFDIDRAKSVVKAGASFEYRKSAVLE